MPRPIYASIDVDAMRHNLQAVRQRAPDARIWAVIKANAYGHGIEHVFEAARGADGLAVLDFSEAERLRRLDWRGPILMLEGVFESRDLEWCSRLDLWHVIHNDAQVDWLATHKTHVGHRVFLKLNSGMNRLGFEPQAFRAAWSRLNALPQVEEISLMTHFADADGPRGIDRALAVYREATDGMMGAQCVANSAATLRHLRAAKVPSDWVRVGIALYGSAPDHPEHTADHWDLRPVMSLRSELIAVQRLQPGDCVGYGSLFTATEPMRVGIVACGYADGYPRHAIDAPVLVGGVRTHTVGRVSMDMLAVDLRPCDAAGIEIAVPGTEVVLWGRSATGAVLSADSVAEASDTIAYELFCAINSRVTMRVA
ncbi:MAG: Alanine racemase, catabolic [Pseudomonadota bacterium]